MNDKKAEPLQGYNNKRLFSDEPINNEGTAAWAAEEKIRKVTNVTAPSERNTYNAKEWVDDGSKL